MNAAETLVIEYKPAYRAFWHCNCTNHLGGVMRLVSHEEAGSTLECLHCGMRGSYPVGAVGEVTVPVITRAAAEIGKGGE